MAGDAAAWLVAKSVPKKPGENEKPRLMGIIGRGFSIRIDAAENGLEG